MITSITEQKRVNGISLDNKRVFFPNLDGLRFIAALMVIVTHIEQMKMFKKMAYYKYPMHTGTLGVTIFFVLSGFLITYLLLSEERTFKTIQVRKFYMRRMLRIWPLYYLIVLVAFFLLPYLPIFSIPDYGIEVIYQYFSLKFLLFILFLPNLSLSMFGFVPFVSQTWSVGTEEQFYLFWPWVFKIVKKYRVMVLFMLIIVYHLFMYLLDLGYFNFLPNKKFVKMLIEAFNFDYMAIGGIFSIWLFDKNKILRFILNNYTFYVSLLLFFALWLNNVSIPYFYFQVYSLLFAIIILNFAANEQLRVSLENSLLQYLGKISYGLYMFNSIAIVFAIELASLFNSSSDWLIYPLSILLSILMAAISYVYIEKYFLEFKIKFSNIFSGRSSVI